MWWACLRACRSEPQMPQASVLTSTCPAVGLGSGSVSTTISPFLKMAARIGDPLTVCDCPPSYHGGSEHVTSTRQGLLLTACVVCSQDSGTGTSNVFKVTDTRQYNPTRYVSSGRTPPPTSAEAKS